MIKGKLKISTCQFAVRGSINRNAQTISHYVRKASDSGADIVHFPECALSGYAGVDFENFEGFEWELLSDKTQQICELAGKLGIWVVLPSLHKFSEKEKPYNSLYLIGPDGEIKDRYDKRFCMSKELEFYTPGDRWVHFKINGVKCSLLVCFDVRFPEIYRKLYQDGVKCVLQSFYNARQEGPSVHTDIMRQTLQTRAASNNMWAAMANSSGYYSPYPSCFIRPDGKIEAQLKFNKAGMMINTADLSREFYDPMAGFREMAMEGRFTNRPKK